LELQGFKSFCERTELRFHGEGIAGIVGPNGCGKSNISDAISWVLGEQSAKTLRGTRMEDVIFAGTRERKPLGMASVTMTLIDPEIYQPHVAHKPQAVEGGQAPKSGEVTITRRLFRSGDSEYLIDGRIARLRDIQDLFMGTGLGPESYAIIEQGRIGQILSSKPTDRRAIIEEAAGITKFKTRKRLAEARLEDAKLNLARINDIFEEVTRQMNSLKRQASKAERYARLRDEMRSKLRVVLASKFSQLDEETSTLDVQLAEVGEELRVKGEAVQQMEGEHGERTQRGYAIERESQENREKLNNLALEIDRAAARRSTNEERCSELDARSAGAQAEIGNTEEQLTRLQQELQTNRATLESADADVTAAQQELQQRQQEASAAASSLLVVERQQEQRRDAILQAVGTTSALRNRITQAEERMAALDREAQRLHDETLAAHQQLESFGGQQGQLGLEFETASQRVDALTAQLTETRQNLDAKRAA